MLSRVSGSLPTQVLPEIDFDSLVARRIEMAKNELLVARAPNDHERYLAFQMELSKRKITLEANTMRVISSLGEKSVRSALLRDDYPANVTSTEDQMPVIHYNLWLRKSPLGPDMVAGEEALSQLEGRDPSREVYCFKRPPTQSIPHSIKFPFEHAHIFTTATVPEGGVVVMEDPAP